LEWKVVKSLGETVVVVMVVVVRVGAGEEGGEGAGRWEVLEPRAGSATTTSSARIGGIPTREVAGWRRRGETEEKDMLDEEGRRRWVSDGWRRERVKKAAAFPVSC